MKNTLLDSYCKYLKTKQCFIERDTQIRNLFKQMVGKTLWFKTKNKHYKVVGFNAGINVSFGSLTMKLIRDNGKISWFTKHVSLIDVMFGLAENNIEIS